MRCVGLCERAQSKCTWTCHQSHLMRGFKGKMPCPTTATPVLREPAQSKCTWTCHKSHSRPKFTGNMPDYAIEMHTDMSQEPFYAKFIWKMPNANTATPSLCEPAQSKCTWTFHKSHFVRNLKGKCQTLIPRHPFCASLRSRNAHGHVTRAMLCGNLQGKCRTRRIPPRLNSGA